MTGTHDSAQQRQHLGTLLIVCGPSGVGKSTLCDRLLDEFDDLAFSISYTTRAPRGTEKDGVNYHFVSEDRFAEMIKEGAFAEFADVHGNQYGTTIATINDARNVGTNLIFDVDYQGARQLKEAFPDAAAVLVIPPSMASLSRRLEKRRTDDAATITRRLQAARHEMSHVDLFDYVVVNDNVERACDALRAVYVAQHYARSRMRDLVRQLVEEP